MIENRPSDKIDPETCFLSKGSHKSSNDGVCVMELAAYLAHEPHSDRPECVSPIIGEFLRKWNDDLSDESRQMLRPYAARVLNTRDEHDDTRFWLIVDWMIREYTPAWLDCAGLTDHAAVLRGLSSINSKKRVEIARPLIDAAATDATASWAAAKDAAWSAAWDAAKVASADAAKVASADAAWSAAWNAAGVASADAAGVAAWDAAKVASADAAWSAAWNAAGVAAKDAAWSAAWDAAKVASADAAGVAAWDAAKVASADAAEQKLAPTVASLQKSALSLLDRMILVGGGQ